MYSSLPSSAYEAGEFISLSSTNFWSVVTTVLTIVAFWKIFQKAGEEGWKAIIPFYNQYTEFKIFWTTKWFWITLIATAVPFVIGLISIIIGVITAMGAGITIKMHSFIEGAGSLLGIGGALFGLLILMAGGIFYFVIDIMLKNRISKSFGHGAGFTCGLVFFAPIFLMILAFNKDKYKKLSK